MPPTDEEDEMSTSVVDVKDRRSSKLERFNEFRHTRIKRCKHWTKKFIAALCSQVGIGIAVTAYTAIGGIIFKELEAPYEKRQRDDVVRFRERAVHQLWNYTFGLRYLYRKNWTRDVEPIIAEFQNEVFKAVKDNGWSGNDEEEEDQWNFAGALLYSLTIITTIGYGHITPKTPWGRILTILYALPGIPLMFLCLANIGSFLASTFSILYVNTRKSINCMQQTKRRLYSCARNCRGGRPSRTSSMASSITAKNQTQPVAYATGDKATLEGEIMIDASSRILPPKQSRHFLSPTPSTASSANNVPNHKQLIRNKSDPPQFSTKNHMKITKVESCPVQPVANTVVNYSENNCASTTIVARGQARNTPEDLWLQMLQKAEKEKRLQTVIELGDEVEGSKTENELSEISSSTTDTEDEIAGDMRQNADNLATARKLNNSQRIAYPAESGASTQRSSSPSSTIGELRTRPRYTKSLRSHDGSLDERGSSDQRSTSERWYPHSNDVRTPYSDIPGLELEASSPKVVSKPKRKVHVPLTVSISVIFLYVMAGATLFHLWEDDWSFLVGAYFCFVTLTTIGLGDFVPGTNTDTAAAQEKLIFTALYSLFGMALISMCISLMQEEIKNKFRWLGYGHITPKTPWGRIVTILYAMPGIPLMFMCLANIGNTLATMFRLFYIKIIRGDLFKRNTKRRPKGPRNGAPGAPISAFEMRLRRAKTSRALAERRRDENSAASFHHAPNTLSPIAEGIGSSNEVSPLHVTEVVSDSELIETSSSKLGTASVAATSAEDKFAIELIMEEFKKRKPVQKMPKKKVDKISVPLTFSILLIVIYILAGATLFSWWEDDWNFLVGSYFCFITLSTIGFGDFVPGTKTDTKGAQEKLIFTGLYLLFGLAIICMCFDLMQEEVRNKFRWLGKKIGILDDE